MHHLMVRGSVAVLAARVPNQLHAADHLPDREETNSFGRYHTNADHLLVVHALNSLDNALWAHGLRGRLCGARCLAERCGSERADHVLEVSLEGSHVPMY